MTDFYLTCPGPSVTRAEREWLKGLAMGVECEFPSPTFVNIGVWCGCTMHCLRAGSPSATLYGIDIDYETRKPVNTGLLKAEFIEADSGSYTIEWPHLVFIDGDHSYEGVKRDIDNWAPQLVKGGIMAFHDYNPTPTDLRRFKLEGVRRAVDEFVVSSGWAAIDGADSLKVLRKP